MQIFVVSKETHTLDVQPEDDVYTIKEMIEKLENISPEDQVVYLNGQPLDDEESLSELQQGSTVNVTLRLAGGKVHGSLARAGKVKGQTPKVEKQEKRKKKTGRAKRRMLYNKRFVNVVATFGRRRGPNANAQ